MGLLERSGIGEPVDCDIPASIDELRNGCAKHNMELLAGLKPNEFEDELLKLTVADAALERMSHPVPGAHAARWAQHLHHFDAHSFAASQCDLTAMKLHPRFGVEQGVR